MKALIMATSAYGRTKRLFLILPFLFIFSFSFSSSYTVVDYEDFDEIPTGTTGNDLVGYGFLNISSGLSLD
jgi:ABC-type spermidine/putrescine transport system permease subunit II